MVVGGALATCCLVWSADTSAVTELEQQDDLEDPAEAGQADVTLVARNTH
jgi:hypothetical protein